MLDVLEPKVVLAGPGLPLAALDDVVAVRGEGSWPGGGAPFEALLAGPAIRTSPNRPSDLAAVIFTSGSTGRPKAVLHTHRGLAYKARSMTRVHGLSGGDAVLMPAPLAHISGLLNAVLVPGAAGMKAVLMERWDVGAGLRLMEDERISFMIGPPSMFSAVIEDAGFSPGKVASMRVVSSGMMGVSPEFIDAARIGLGAMVKRSYGSSEAPTVSRAPTTTRPSGAVTPTGGPSATRRSASPTPSPAAGAVPAGRARSGSAARSSSPGTPTPPTPRRPCTAGGSAVATSVWWTSRGG